ncbi:MAG TPA: AI-2E family transporter [Candidatus Limnocylindrales bacterium]
MRSETIRWAARGAGLAIGIGVVLLVARVVALAMGVVLLVFVAVLLASALEPVIGHLRARLGIGRAWTVLLVYAAFLAMVAIVVLLVAPVAIAQAATTYRAIPGLLDGIDAWAGHVQPPALGTAATSVTTAARELLAHPPTPNTTTLLETGVSVAEAAVSIVTLLVIVFFWLVEHARLQRYILAFVPEGHRPAARAAWNRVETRLGLWVRGQLILMGAIGIATGIIYTLVGLPAALLLAVIAAICEAIPLVGPALGAVPALIVAITVSPQVALVVLVAYLVLHLVEGNVLVPLVMRNTVGLSPFLVLVSLLVGGAAAGIVGAFVAVPLVAALEIVLEPLQARDEPVAPEPPPEVDEAVEEENEEEIERVSPDSPGGHGSPGHEP